MTTFREFLRDRIAAGGFSTEDTLAAFLPLAEQVLQTHVGQSVAPLEGTDALRVQQGKLWFEQNRQCSVRHNEAMIRKLEAAFHTTLEVIRQTEQTLLVDDGESEQFDLLIGTHPPATGEQNESNGDDESTGDDGSHGLNEPGGAGGANENVEITQPLYYPAYVAWEHRIGHHDPLTDIYSLGLILASLACHLDFHRAGDLERFVASRRNLFELNADLHPVLAQAIFRMTELDRHRRPPDLGTLIHNLENYREQQVDIEFDLASIPGFGSKDLKTRQQVVLNRLQERLFEISRRNRLLHFRPTMHSINLTHASIPICFDVQNIRPDHLLTWGDDLQKWAVDEVPLSLNQKLNFAEAIYLPPILDRIRAEAGRDEKEYGFAQLRIVACFLNWTNLKEQPHERFHSPLILLPVKLIKRKGIRDSYFLESLSHEAEVNPVVRHQFRSLYGIELPESIDLTSTTLDTFFDYLDSKIRESSTGVTLQKIDKPRIDLIHQKAKRYLDQYRRRARIAGRGVRTYLDLEYSYDPANYHPLGLKLFEARVRTRTTLLHAVVQQDPPNRRFLVPPASGQNAGNAPAVEKKKAFYALRDGGDENPYVWNFDLCSVTLANFRYRKMSLVRDYEALVREPVDNPAFDATFSLVPRPTNAPTLEPPEWRDRYYVVPCDPTQSKAIAQSRTGDSYIIQGPPGTGKSQTITNLIADYVSQGQRVLFVCEKRAAIDVVFARLRQQGLGMLCCLIHDSQTDKKAFVMDLKRTYEDFVEGSSEDATKERQNVLRRLKRRLRPLEKFHAAMNESPAETGLPVHELLTRAVALPSPPNFSVRDQERLPRYADWEQHHPALQRFFERFSDLEFEGTFAEHPLRWIRPELVEVERPIETVLEATDQARRELAQLHEILSHPPLTSSDLSFRTLRGYLEYANQIKVLADIGQLGLIEPDSEASSQWRSQVSRLRQLEQETEQARHEARHWTHPLPPEEVEIALNQARRMEGNWLAVVTPRWWKLRSVLNKSYQFDQHSIQPGWVQVLTWLKVWYDAQEHVDHENEQICRALGYSGSLTTLQQRLNTLREQRDTWPEEVRELHDRVRGHGNAAEFVRRLERAGVLLERIESHLDQFRIHDDECRLTDLAEELAAIQEHAESLPDFLDCIHPLQGLPSALVDSLRRLELPPQTLEAAIAATSLESVFRRDRETGRFSGEIRSRNATQLEDVHDTWLTANSKAVLAMVRDRFGEKLHVASLPASQLDEDQKEFKKEFNRGRRELEHEFGKSMRYKSIRDLVSAESGQVVQLLKPVWLMSPLSVSDTLPLDTSHFDVVIFDEASQITLEEAIPSLFRASQAIVVGDEMQLPPTDFFSSRRETEDDELLVEEDGELVEYDLSSNSFLTHASRNLGSWMLGWHYRSRSESLISYSNWAFYDGRLLTIPEEHLPGDDRKEIIVASPDTGDGRVDDLVDRPVSFHFLEEGVYENRRNRSEADYIAHLVRGLLSRDSSVSIGIVAFSEAQQSEIENALQRLARDDREFQNRLDAELEREEDGQFVGLLVKNLENIQGDERDVIILSVCYGYNQDGRMIMNFGPINKSGGEKRLNVAFSRAKHHMALVSSIRHTDITNDYNDGANCLKNYLRYAAAVSVGDTEARQRVLLDISKWRSPGSHTEEVLPPDAVTLAIARQMKSAGYEVDLGVGQSHFRCDIAVRARNETTYRLGILVDHPQAYGTADLFDREVARPRLLRIFGWNVALVLAKDWFEDARGETDRLLQLLENAQPPGDSPTESEPADERANDSDDT